MLLDGQGLVDGNPSTYAPSPVHKLQQELSDALAPDPGERWSPRAGMGFVITVCGSFWLTFATGLGAVLR
jgi:hypothetical protein